MMLLQKRNCSRVSEPVIWFCHQVIGARPSVNISDERKKNNLRKTLVFSPGMRNVGTHVNNFREIYSCCDFLVQPRGVFEPGRKHASY